MLVHTCLEYIHLWKTVCTFIEIHGVVVVEE